MAAAPGAATKREELGPLMLDQDKPLPAGSLMLEQDKHPPAPARHSELWPKFLLLVLLLLLLLMPTLLFVDVAMIVMREPSAATIAAMAAKILILGLASTASCSSRPSGCGKRWQGAACACALLVGLAVPVICVQTLLLQDYAAPASFPIIEGNASAAPRVAIIGGGPSGMAALWALRLHAPERDVTLFEMTDSVGGHGTTVHDRGKPIDIGFIFSTPTYALYHALRSRYGHEVSASNISLTFHGDEARGLPRWHNKGGAPTSAELAAEIERFREEVRRSERNMPLSQLIEPLWLWLWRRGFSAEFSEGVLRPALTPLFVTARGSMMQSAGATRAYFRRDGSMPFLSLDLQRDGAPTVFHTVGGVNRLHEALLAEAAPSDEALRLNTEVLRVRRTARGTWRLTSRRRRGLPGGRCDAADGGCVQDEPAGAPHASTEQQGEEPREEEFDAVIFACSAQVSASLLPRGALRSLLGVIDYDAFRVTLSEPAPQDDVRQDASLYHIYPNGLMAGAIDRIDEVASTACGAEHSFCPGEYKLEVEPADNPPRARTHFGPRIIATRHWAHHRFSLWELILTHRLLPRLNHLDGLHVAGDYVNGYGHEDALKSGLHAACRVGIAAQAKALIHSDGFAPKLNTAWASKVIRQTCPYE